MLSKSQKTCTKLAVKKYTKKIVQSLFSKNMQSLPLKLFLNKKRKAAEWST